MAILQANRLTKASFMNALPLPANTDEAYVAPSPDQKIMAWLFRISPAKTAEQKPLFRSPSALEQNRRVQIEYAKEPLDDWQTVASLSGHTVQEWLASGSALPLSAAEIDHFRRNHRETDRLVERDFLTAKTDLPTPIAELYGLYCHRARLDAEATLFVAQATGSVRVARVMADLLAIGAFASGHECVPHLTMTYSVPAAFDTSDLIDRTADEAVRRLALPIESPSHLLKLTPDEISVLACHIVERHILSADEFLEKANLLAEARQDVHRMPVSRRLSTALAESDLPHEKAWVIRLCAAYARVFKSWVPEMPEVTALLQQTAAVHALKDAD